MGYNIRMYANILNICVALNAAHRIRYSDIEYNGKIELITIKIIT